MIGWLRRMFRRDHTTADREDERLKQAAAEVHHLQVRAEAATSAINRRHGRNHWQESIDEMIQTARNRP